MNKLFFRLSLLFLIVIIGFFSCKSEKVDTKENELENKVRSILELDSNISARLDDGVDNSTCIEDVLQSTSCVGFYLTELIRFTHSYCDFIEVKYHLTVCKDAHANNAGYTKLIVSDLEVTPIDDGTNGCQNFIARINSLPYLEKIKLLEWLEREASLELERLLVLKFVAPNNSTCINGTVEVTFLKEICYKWCTANEIEIEYWSGLKKFSCGTKCCQRDTYYCYDEVENLTKDGPYFTTIGECTGSIPTNCQYNDSCIDNCGW